MMTKLSFLPGATRRAPRFLLSSVAVLGLAFGAAACGDDDDGDPADGVNAPFNTTGRVTISGTPMVGETLTAMVTDQNGVSGTVAYQWAAGGTDINGATAETYVLTLAEVGETMTVTASYTDDDGFTESIMSTSTEAVEGIPNIVGMVSIAGIPTVGQTLTSSLTDDNGLTTATPAYQWQAGGTAIAGATGETYVLTLAEDGAMITVTVTYTDDGGNTETLTSNALGPVSTDIVNVPGTVEISGTNVVGEMLSADITDANGATGAITYQWAADGTDVDGATGQTFTLTADQRGQTMSVTVSYTDDNDFVEGPLMATDDDIVYTVITTDETTLLAAAAAAVEGDAIGIGDGTYADMATIDFTADGLLIRRVTGGTAVIAGVTCIVIRGTGTVMDGLAFDDLDWFDGSLCNEESGEGTGDGSVRVTGSGHSIRNCEFLGEASPRSRASGDPYHYIVLTGLDHLIERNVFQGKDTDNEGSAVSMFADAEADSNQGHTIQFNLFSDFLGGSGDSDNRDSTAHAIQVGRSTGQESTGDGLFTVQHNRFQNMQTERRIMRVQSSNNLITGNTFVNTTGLIGLEDGFGSTVSRNVILSGGEDNDDGGISFAPLGHTVVDNYITNMRTTSSQRGALVLNMDPLNGSGNTTILADSSLDLTVTVARNTIVNARQAILYDDGGTDSGTPDCQLTNAILDFDDNLVSNQDSSNNPEGNTNGSGRDVISDADFLADSCTLASSSSFENNHFYSATLSESGTFDFNGNASGNTVGDENNATVVIDETTGLVDGSGPDAGVGVDTSILTIIDETMVGPGSTWVPES